MPVLASSLRGYLCLLCLLGFLYFLFVVAIIHAPAITDTTLATCAFVNPKNDRGLMRINSTANRATPVKIKYAANTRPGWEDVILSAGTAPAARNEGSLRAGFPARNLFSCVPSRHKIQEITAAATNS